MKKNAKDSDVWRTKMKTKYSQAGMRMEGHYSGRLGWDGDSVGTHIQYIHAYIKGFIWRP